MKTTPCSHPQSWGWKKIDGQKTLQIDWEQGQFQFRSVLHQNISILFSSDPIRSECSRARNSRSETISVQFRFDSRSKWKVVLPIQLGSTLNQVGLPKESAQMILSALIWTCVKMTHNRFLPTPRHPSWTPEVPTTILLPFQWKYWHRAKNRLRDKTGFGMYYQSQRYCPTKGASRAAI